jgi:ubiquinone/menaquinone biosynthesis C-methylase UbiE
MSVEPTEILDELVEVRGRDVLDVGCGEGWLVRRLATSGARPVGLDPLAVALERARQQDPGAPPGRYLQGAAESLPFGDASFDVVVFFNSLHHVPVESIDAALAQAARALRPGGVVYVQEPLAQGAFFDLMRPVEDETPVRAAAQTALERAAAGSWRELARREAVIATELANFEAFQARMLSVDPARAAAFAEHESGLRAEFDRLAQRSGERFVFDQPFRVHLLAP